MGTVKMIARGASEFAPTSVTLFCAMRSGLAGDCCAKSIIHTPLRRKDALDYPHIYVTGRQRTHSDNHGADLQRQLVVPVEIHVREVVDVRIERVRGRGQGRAHAGVVHAGTGYRADERKADIVAVQDGCRRRRARTRTKILGTHRVAGRDEAADWLPAEEQYCDALASRHKPGTWRAEGERNHLNGVLPVV